MRNGECDGLKKSVQKVTNTNWSTPQKFFDLLNDEFGFTLDVAATEKNTKCKRYFSLFALEQDWSGHVFWMNPPYGRGIDVYSWVKKAYYSAQHFSTK